MKLQAFSKDKKITKPVYLKLVNLSGGVKVVAVDEKGEPIVSGNLITFYENGTIGFHGSVNRSLGFALNSDGRIKVEE